MNFKQNEWDAAFKFVVGFEGCFDKVLWNFRTGKLNSSDLVNFCEEAKTRINWINKILKQRTWNSHVDVLRLAKVQQEFKNLISFAKHLHISKEKEQ